MKDSCSVPQFAREPGGTVLVLRNRGKCFRGSHFGKTNTSSSKSAPSVYYSQKMASPGPQSGSPMPPPIPMGASPQQPTIQQQPPPQQQQSQQPMHIPPGHHVPPGAPNYPPPPPPQQHNMPPATGIVSNTKYPSFALLLQDNLFTVRALADLPQSLV